MSTTGFQFTSGDAEILNYVYQLRVATIDHLAALTNRSHKALERRLPRLRDERYLKTLKPRPQKGLYVLGSHGVSALIEGGFAPDEFVVRRRREAEWKDLYIPHALHIANIHAKLLLLSRSSTTKLVHWQHDEPRLWDTVQTNEGKLPVRPDAFFVLQESAAPADRFHFFLEADVGSMSHHRIEQKITAYAAYHREQRQVAKFGIRYFQVAIVTQSEARAANLHDELYPRMSAGQRRAYHFVSVDALSPSALLAATDRAAA